MAKSRARTGQQNAVFSLRRHSLQFYLKRHKKLVEEEGCNLHSFSGCTVEDSFEKKSPHKTINTRAFFNDHFSDSFQKTIVNKWVKIVFKIDWNWKFLYLTPLEDTFYKKCAHCRCPQPAQDQFSALSTGLNLLPKFSSKVFFYKSKNFFSKICQPPRANK